MKRLILPALVFTLLASCTEQEIVGERPGDGTERIVFGSSIEAITRVRDDAATAFENDERIGVFGYRMAAAGATTDFTQDLFLDQVEFTYDATTPGAEKFVSKSADALWKLGSAHNFYAYYPTTLAVTNAATGATAPLTVAEGSGIDAANDVMVAHAWTPVCQKEMKEQALEFRHVLSKVKFKIKKESVATPNIKLTNLTFDMKSNTGSVNLMTGLVANTAGSVTLHNGDAPAAQDVTSTTPAPIPGSWLVLPDDEISELIFTLDDQQMKVPSVTIRTVAGKITVITIIVNGNNISFTSTIIPWGEDAQDVSDLELLTPIIEYGMYPYSYTDNFEYYARTLSYNDYYGTVADGHNGQYFAAPAILPDFPARVERPYYRFEVALTNAYTYKAGDRLNWGDLYGTKPDHSDNICVQKHGKGWRMPRIAELEMILINSISTLNSTLEALGAEPLRGGYWASTEFSEFQAWAVPSKYPIRGTGRAKVSWEDMSVRCIKELPVQTGPILEYGVAPHNQVGILQGSTTNSYNSYYGSVFDGHNGNRYEYPHDAFKGEPPYHKFEVALIDAYVADRGLPPLVGSEWPFVPKKPDQSDSHCVQVHGEGWRMPRIAEAYLMGVNRKTLMAELAKLGGNNAYYGSMSSTQHNRGFYYKYCGSDILTYELDWYNIRCIREIHP